MDVWLEWVGSEDPLEVQAGSEQGQMGVLRVVGGGGCWSGLDVDVTKGLDAHSWITQVSGPQSPMQDKGKGRTLKGL